MLASVRRSRAPGEHAVFGALTARRRASKHPRSLKHNGGNAERSTMPIQVNLNELEAPPPAPAPAPQQVPSWAQPSNRMERRCVATNECTVRRAAELDSEVVGELRAGDHCTVDGQQHISRQGRVVERSRICAPLNGWVSSQRLAPADDVAEVDARRRPRCQPPSYPAARARQSDRPEAQTSRDLSAVPPHSSPSPRRTGAAG